MAARFVVRTTAWFATGLRVIDSWLALHGTARAWNVLLDDTEQRVMPNLADHPRMGRLFVAQPALSSEAEQRMGDLAHRFTGAEFREYLLGDYLILYAVSTEHVDLLAIRHHRQNGYDIG